MKNVLFKQKKDKIVK